MRTIWKYQFDTTDSFGLQIPEGAEILSVQVQHGKPCMWVLVDKDKPVVQRRFRVYGTGHPIEAVGLTFLGTYQVCNGDLIFHVFEHIY